MFEELIKQTKETYNQDYTEIEIAGSKVKVYKYIPIELKKRLVDNVLDTALGDNGIYNEVLLDIAFALSILDVYTDVEVEQTEENGINGIDIYNYFNKNGYFEQIVNCIDEDEYKQLFNYVTVQRTANEKGHIGIINYINNLVANLPKDLEGLQKVFESVDAESAKNVISMLKDANESKEQD